MAFIKLHNLIFFLCIGFSFGNEKIIHSLVERLDAMEKREGLLTGKIAELEHVITSLKGEVSSEKKMNRDQETKIANLADFLRLDLQQSIQDNHTLNHDLMARMRRLVIGDQDVTPVAFSAFLQGDINNVPGQYLVKMKLVKLNEGDAYNSNDAVGDHDGTPVAFSASLQGDIHDVPAQHLVKMKLVKLNEGNAYNSNDGIFFCPKPGLYLFHWSGMATSGKYFYLNLMVNGLAYAQIHAVSSPSFQMSSNAALVRLNIGDHVLIETAGPTSSLHGSYCSFSGVRLSD